MGQVGDACCTTTTQYYAVLSLSRTALYLPDFFAAMAMGRDPLEHLAARHMYVCGAMADSLGPRNSPLYTYSLEGTDLTPCPWPVWVLGGTARSSTSTEGKNRLPC
jgi:hypothetical protein